MAKIDKHTLVVDIENGHYVVRDNNGDILYITKDAGDAINWIIKNRYKQGVKE